MKYYFITGERSGDLHAGNLVKELRKKDQSADIRAVGGSFLEEQGVKLFLNYQQISFMGFVEVAINLRKISAVMKSVKADILSWKPDVVVLVDFAGFNLRIARFLKENNIKVFYYISPKLWAWNQKRALKVKQYVDRMFVIMPFEKDFYKTFEYEVDYVGNPVMDAISGFKTNPGFKEKINKNKPVVALLPGSRKQEVTKMLDVMQVVSSRFPEYHFVVAAVSNLPKELYSGFSRENLSVVYDSAYDLLSIADAAIVTSGTATLETALFNVPQIVVYKTNFLTYSIAKRLIKVKYISLVNLIADKEVVKELIQDDYNLEAVSDNLKLILSEKGREGVLDGYSVIRKKLENKTASITTADLIYKYLTE